jgi:hypothetical protein
MVPPTAMKTLSLNFWCLGSVPNSSSTSGNPWWCGPHDVSIWNSPW